MKLLKAFVTLLVCIGPYCSANAQSGLKCKTINTGNRIELDSLSVLPGSVFVLPKLPFQISENTIQFADPVQDSVQVCYRTFPFRFEQEQKMYDRRLKDTAMFFATGNHDVEVREELFTSPGIEKSGVLSRGISVGNKQDVFVNSNLNLQMQGELSDGIKLNAVISDQNIPFQPEGNTQQIQEFDQIFINLDHKNWNLKAGDVLMTKNEAFYMKYFKKVQGVNFEVKTGRDSSGYRTGTYAGGALAKGKFNTMMIGQIEGVQGPYRLQGVNGERFIIIVANTEKVFLDGKELIRGFDFDYTIDYNSAEIIFNNHIVITKFSRIRIDFEYTERNYARSVYTLGHQIKSNNLEVGVDFFNERDNRRQFLQGELPISQQVLLSQIGDSLQNAFEPSGFPAGEGNEGRILYEKRDTLGTTIFVYKNGSVADTGLYVVDFSEVGSGRGDYIKQVTTVNGRVYQWVGQNEGNYLPISIIPAPNKRQMMLLTANKKVGKNATFSSELAYSDKDVNLFSDLDDNDDQGIAFKVGYDIKDIKLGKKYKISSGLDVQHQGARFNPLDRIRSVDFERDWNALSTETATENLVNVQFGVKDSIRVPVSYRMSFRNKKGLVNGLQHELKLNNRFGSVLELHSKVFVMDNRTSGQAAQWRRLYLNPELILSDKIRPGYEYNMDKNKVTENDSIKKPLMNYDEHVLYVRGGDSLKGGLNIEHRFRKDYLPEDNTLDWINSKWNDKSHTTSLSLNGKVGKHQDLKLTGSYRVLASRLNSFSEDSVEQNMLGRLDWNVRMLSRSLNSALVYVINTSRELVREVQYIPVLTSQGTHIWMDYNGDGVKDIDEFQQVVEGVNNGADTLYAKFFFPTSDYVKAFSHNLNYRLNLKTPTIWEKATGVKKFMSRFNNSTYFVVDKKTTDTGLNERLNPFSTSLTFDAENENVISLKRNIRSTLFFNRTDPKFALDVTKTSQGAKQLLTYGQDGRYLDEWRINSRTLLRNIFTLKMTGKISNKESRSTYLTSREYQISGTAVGGDLACQFKRSIRFTVGYDWSNVIGSSDSFDPTAKINEANIELKIRQLSKNSGTFTFRYVNIAYESTVEGSENSPLAYDMLQALRPGNNYLWKYNMQRRLSNGLNLNLIYEGRKSGSNSIVHTGRMQVSALF